MVLLHVVVVNDVVVNDERPELAGRAQGARSRGSGLMGAAVWATSGSPEWAARFRRRAAC